MQSFHDRIDVAQITAIWDRIHQSNFLTDQDAWIVHDVGRMRNRIALLHQAFPDHTLHALAIKANPLVEVLRAAVNCGSGLEAASIEEVHLAITAGCEPNRIVFDSPAKTVSEIDQALTLGLHLNADNFSELHRIALSLASTPSTSTVGLRVNPEVGVGTIAHTSVGAVGSKFGVSISRDREKIFDAFRSYDWLKGLHVHVGSQGCDLNLLANAAQKIQQLRGELVERGYEVSTVNIGGGLPAVYCDDDAPPSPKQYAQALANSAPDLMQGNVQLMTEFGRSVQAGCGTAFSRVEYVRESTSGDQPTMAVIHLGADFLLRPVYRSAEWSHEFVLLDAEGRPKVGPDVNVAIAGPLCFSGDFVGQVSMPSPQVGDWIAIRDCGAYTLSMWSRHCSRGIPIVLGVDDEEVTLLRRAESPADIARFWSESGISD